MKDKILIMSMAGLTDLPEDVKPLHVYLLSLKECVVPHYDTKVILYNSSLTSEKTQQLVIDYGLESVVEIKKLEDMELPIRSYEFMKSVTYWGNRIGLVMNMMFDYAKQNNFFDAKWVFQTDTDVEFLSDFSETLRTTESMQSINPAIVITHAGDVYEYNISVGEKIGYFKSPRRLNLYDVNDPLESSWQSFRFEPQTHTHAIAPRQSGYFNTQQLKTRNDFVGLSSQAAKRTSFNWIHAVSYIKIKNATGFVVGDVIPEELREQFPESEWESESGNFGIGINKDKGSLVAYELYSAKNNVIQVQLPGYNTMMNHINAGWCNESYHARALASLENKYIAYKHIWSRDFEE